MSVRKVHPFGGWRSMRLATTMVAMFIYNRLLRALLGLFIFVAVFPGKALADSPTASPSTSPATSHTPTPTASASPSPSPSSTSLTLGPLTIDGVFSGFSIFTSGVNASGSLDTPTGADLSNRTDVSNAFLIVNKTSSTFRYGFAAGAYNIPVVGFALNRTTQSGANTSLYGAVPSIYIEYAPTSSFNLQAGKLATFIGQESTYTYQNANIQRGIIWNIETAVSRGIRANFAGSKFNGALEGPKTFAQQVLECGAQELLVLSPASTSV